MWIPKWVRDRKKGVDSAVPTQVVSNEEFIPRPQTKKQKQVEYLINIMGEENARRLGMERRAFMASSMGIATCFLASNKVFGNYWDVNEEETLEAGAYEDKYPKSDYFIIDVQSHFTNGVAIGFRNAEFVKNMGFKLDDSDESYAFPNFVKEMYFDSETAMLVISGVPGRKAFRPQGRSARGPKRGGGVLPSWLMSCARRTSTTWPAASERCAKGTAPRITTGT